MKMRGYSNWINFKKIKQLSFCFSTTQALILEMEDAALISLLDANFEEDSVVS